MKMNVEDDYNPESHKTLLQNISNLGKTQHIRKATRSEPQAIIDEFHLVKTKKSDVPRVKEGKIAVNDIVQILKSSEKHAKARKQLKNVAGSKKVLPKPLEKPKADRIKRSIGYENIKKKLGRWDAVVAKNRTAETQIFPLAAETIYVNTSAFGKPLQTSLKSQLALEMREAETKLKVLKREKMGDFTDEKEQAKLEKEFLKKKMTKDEITAQRKELAYLRMKESQKSAKARLQNKIKSKKYHKLLKRQKLKAQIKEFELLQKTNPEAALEKLNAIEKNRALERASLRHKNTGTWAKNLQVRAKYDVEVRKDLAEQLQMSREITQKKFSLHSDDEEDNSEKSDSDSEALKSKVDPFNPWVKVTKDGNKIEQEEDSNWRKYWSARNENEKLLEEYKKEFDKAANDNEDSSAHNVSESKEPLKSHKAIYPKGSVKTKLLKKSQVDRTESNDSGEGESTENIEICKINNSKCTLKAESVKKNQLKKIKSKNSVKKMNENNNVSEDDLDEDDRYGQAVPETKTISKVLKKKPLMKVKVNEAIKVFGDQNESDIENDFEETTPKRTVKGKAVKGKTLKGAKGSAISLPQKRKKTSTDSQLLEKNDDDSSETICKRETKSTASLPNSTNATSQNKCKTKKLLVKNLEDKKTKKTKLTVKMKPDKTKKLLVTLKSEKGSEKTVPDAETNGKVGLKKKKTVKNLLGAHKIQNIDDIFDEVEDIEIENLKKQLGEVLKKGKKMEIMEKKISENRKLSKMKVKDKNELKNLEDLSFKNTNLRPDIDEELTYEENKKPTDKKTLDSIKPTENASSSTVTTKITENKSSSNDANQEYIDPNKFASIKLQQNMINFNEANEGLSDEEAVMDEEPNSNQQMTISQAFEDDDIIADFSAEKQKESEIKNAEIDLFMPGWGSWAGSGIENDPKSIRSKRIKLTVDQQRKDSKKETVIINEEPSKHLRNHLVSDLPFPFTSLKDYEASIRAPIGRSFVPETAFRMLTRPSIITKKGQVIDPMDESEIVKPNRKLRHEVDKRIRKLESIKSSSKEQTKKHQKATT